MAKLISSKSASGRKAHFIGIAGIGMSAVAKLLKESGWDISGSDEGFYPPASEYLKKHNLPFNTNYRKENVPKDAEVIVIGKNAKLVPETNEEVKAAYESGIPVKSFAEILGELSQNTENVVIAGSYGKSTVTALISWCLTHAGKDPSYFIGAVPIGMENAHIGSDNIFVIEGDEYPTSNTDTRSKFLHYHPHDVLLTSAEHDHVNIFKTKKEYLKPFTDLLGMVPDDGIVVASDEKSVTELVTEQVTEHRNRIVRYGALGKTDWTAENISYSDNTTFNLMHCGQKVTELSTTLLGKHNVENIVGASAMLLEKKLLTPEELQKGIQTFQGIKRRLDLLSSDSIVPVYEGFGSSYEKAKAAFDAIKLHFPNRRLITVFEPHTFSWRNRDTIHWYDNIFKTSDKVLIYEPASQGAGTHEQLTQEEIVDRVLKSGTEAKAIHNEKEGLAILESELEQRLSAVY